jgi:hypothetical protein
MINKNFIYSNNAFLILINNLYNIKECLMFDGGSRNYI